MSEQILKALMQLFAIIARPGSDAKDRKKVVESFLNRQLNTELVREYLKVYDNYYAQYQENIKETEKRRRRISSSSVRVLKICTAINEELAQQQKIVVLVQLLEFVKADKAEITEQELEFIQTVAETFNLNEVEYRRLHDFVLYSFDKIPNSTKVLVIDNIKDKVYPKAKHGFHAGLEGQIRVLHEESSNAYLIRYMGENEMYLNGQLLQQEKVFMFNYGSSVRNQMIKPIYFGDVISRFIEDKYKSRINFEVKNLNFRFKGGKFGLQDMDILEESGRLVGIMGASGAGKSTLLNVLNGTAVPSQGEVLINGVNIHTQKDDIEGIIGHVSQDDLLIEELTVFQNLYYNAKLCFDNYEEEDIIKAVNSTLQSLGLFEIKDLQVGSPLNKKISGGQRKRLNIALELIREPAVLFLDEPTSGLSSRDSENIMDLLKELTLKGKLVFVVIHQPSSDIFKMFDRLIILDTGGYLIYNGDPIESIIYFKSRIHQANWNESECHVCGNVNPEQVFNIVESCVLDEYGKLTKTRKKTPQEWNQYYREFAEENKKEPAPATEMPEISFKTPGKFKQWMIFAKRNILAKLADTQYLAINFLEAPLLAFLLSFIIKYYNVNVTNEYGYTLMKNDNLPVYIFMSVIVAIFVGLTVSAEEIIKDRKILKREAFLNLSWASYLLNKIAVLLAISAIQAFTFVMIGNSIMEIKGMYWQYWLVLFSAWASSNILGLVISDSFKTVVTIYILIPFLVIPQIILSGVMVKYEKLNPTISSPSSIPVYGEAITARWAYEALAVYQYKENKYEEKFYDYDKLMSIAEYKKNYWVPDLNNKVDYIIRNLNKKEEQKEIMSRLEVLRNELRDEVTEPSIQRKGIQKYTLYDSLYYDKIDQEILNETKSYIKSISRDYKKIYNIANARKDEKISSLQQTDEAKEEFLAMKRAHYNEKLAEFVTNSSEVDRVVEFEGKLYQKIDPIFLDPEPLFLKAHFYAPRKKIFGIYYPTFWVNIAVIWAMSLMLYVVLYYRLLKRLLDFFERFSGKFSKKE